MALKTLGARTFRARTFLPLSFQLFAIVRKPKPGGGGGGYDYEVVSLHDRLLMDDEEIMAIIVAAFQILG